MLGLYAIAFLAPLLVFGSFGYFITNLHSQDKTVLESQQKTLTVFVYVPIAISYGLILFAATWQFIQYLRAL